MGKQHVERLKEEIPGHVTFAEGYPAQYRTIIFDYLCQAELKDDGMEAEVVAALEDETVIESGSQSTHDAESEPWDFRRELLKLKESYDLSRKRFKDPEFAALLAFVVNQFAPTEYKNRPITKEHLEDACRTLDRKIPSQAAYTLSVAKREGLLDKAKGESGYTLTPKGENRVRELLSAQDKS